MRVVIGIIRENAIHMQVCVSCVVALDTLLVIALLHAHQRILLLVQVMVGVVVWVLRVLCKDNHSILVQLLAVVLKVTEQVAIIKVLGLVEAIAVVQDDMPKDVSMP